MISCYKLTILGQKAFFGEFCRYFLIRIIPILLATTVNCTPESPPSDKQMETTGIWDKSYAKEISLLESRIIELAGKLKIPSVSVAVVKSGKIIYARGFGYADPVNKIPATENTLYHIASITKTFAATIIFKLAEEGKLNIDDYVRKYGVNVPEGVQIKHLMSHTSNFIPGTVFYYNSTRFGLLGAIMEKITGKSFTKLLYETILEPLGMKDTYPNPASEAFTVRGINKNNVINNLAKPYKIENGKLKSSQYPTGFSPGAGMVSNVMDLAKYAIALENNRLFGRAISDIAYTPFSSGNGDTLPYGLGWFVQTINNKKIVWHYGDWKCNSSLIMRIPQDSLTLILLANTDGLSAPFMGLGLPGDVAYSPFADAFLRIFVFNDFDNSFIKDYIENPCTEIINKYNNNNSLCDLVKRIIATAEIEIELANEKDYIKLLKPLYNLFKVTELKNYTGRFSSKSYDINIKKEKGILKAVFVKKNKNKKGSSAGDDNEEYYIFPERENLFYMNTYKKIRFISGPVGKAKGLELLKLGETEYGRRR